MLDNLKISLRARHKGNKSHKPELKADNYITSHFELVVHARSNQCIWCHCMPFGVRPENRKTYTEGSIWGL